MRLMTIMTVAITATLIFLVPASSATTMQAKTMEMTAKKKMMKKAVKAKKKEKVEYLRAVPEK